MSVAPAPAPPSSPTTPRYRGLRGAAAFGLLALAIVLGIGWGVSVFFWAKTGDMPQAAHMAGRILLLAVTAAACATLGRYWCGWEGHALITVRPVRGDFAVLGGCILLMILPGYLLQRYPAYCGGKPAGQAMMGEQVKLEGPTLKDGIFKLTDHPGKVVLVDFWASGWPPSVDELAHIKHVHAKYRANGFEVVGISLDGDRASLTTFLSDHPLPWPQIFIAGGDQKKPFDNPLAQQFGVDRLPYLLLIDKEGNLIARNIRGPQVEAYVASALGETAPWNIRVGSLGSDIAEWTYQSLMAAPWWLLIACGLGGTMVIAMVEATMYRMRGRKAQA